VSKRYFLKALCFILLGLLSSCGPKKTVVNKQIDLFGDVTELEAKKQEFFAMGPVDQKSQDGSKLVKKKIKKLFLTDMKELIHLQEAKLVDVPIPLNSKPIIDFFMPDTTKHEIALGYISGMFLEDATQFYIQEMERLGWQNLAYFSNCESLLNFVKPGKICVVSIRPSDHQDHVKIFILLQNTPNKLMK